MFKKQFHNDNFPQEKTVLANDLFEPLNNTIRVTVPTVGAGIEAQSDGLDIRRQLLSVPEEPAWKSRPALTLGTPYPTSEANNAAAKWITKQCTGRVLAGVYVYRTHIDLTTFNLNTVPVSLFRWLRRAGRPSEIVEPAMARRLGSARAASEDT